MLPAGVLAGLMTVASTSGTGSVVAGPGSEDSGSGALAQYSGSLSSKKRSTSSASGVVRGRGGACWADDAGEFFVLLGHDVEHGFFHLALGHGFPVEPVGLDDRGVRRRSRGA